MNNYPTKMQTLDREPDFQPVADQACQALNSVLRDGVDVHRCLAAQALGRIGAPIVTRPLIAALLDEDEDVRTDAATALSEVADPEANQQLLENLIGDPCTEVKLAAIKALVQTQEKQVIPWLRRMLKGRDEEIVWDEEEFYSSGWDDWVDIQINAVSALAALNVEDAVPDIVAALQNEDAQDMTETGFKALARLGSPGIDALIRFLDKKSTRLRRRAAAVLAKSGSEDAQDALTRAFGDPSSDVRASALRARASVDPTDARLAAFLADPDESIRAEAIQLVGAQHPDHLPALLDDPLQSVQQAVLTVLAKIQGFSADEKLVSGLRSKLTDDAAEISAAAAGALATIAPQAALGDLIELVGDADRPVDSRLGALRGLAAIGGDDAMEALTVLIGDEARSIRLETMAALARLAGVDTTWPNVAGDALLSALRGGFDPEADEDEGEDHPPEEVMEEDNAPPSSITVGDNVIAYPTSTLNAILDDTPATREILHLPDEGVELTPLDMERLALAKRMRGKKRVPLAPDVVLHEDIRRFAARVLGDVHNTDVAHELAFSLAGTDAETRLAAADSLARIGTLLNPLPGTVAQDLMTAMVTADRNEKLPLIRALAACEAEAVIDLLDIQLDDSDCFVRSEAVRALSRLDRVGEKIEALLGDPDPSVRLSAAEAVAKAAGSDVVRLLVDFAFSFEGYHGRQAARLLRGLDVARASASFIDVLGDPEQRRFWSVAIEALEELNCLRPLRTIEIAGRAG